MILNESIVALDPNWKLAYAQEKWAPEFFQGGVAQLEQIVLFHGFPSCSHLIS